MNDSSALPGSEFTDSVNQQELIRLTQPLSDEDGRASLLRYYEGVVGATELSEKLAAVSLLKQTIDSFTSVDADKQLLKLREDVSDYQHRLTRTVEVLTFTKPAPKKLHFVWVGGGIGAIQQDYINIWKQSTEADGYRLNVWYDSDALLAHETNRIIVESAKAMGALAAPEGMKSPSRLASLYVERARALRQQMFEHIQEVMAAGGSADQARVQLLVKAYGQDEMKLKAIRESNLKSFDDLQAKGIRRRDVRAELPALPLFDLYERELGARGNLAAASDMTRLQILKKEGGTYLDADLLPPLHKEIGGLDLTLLDTEARIGVTQLLLDHNPQFLPHRGTQYADLRYQVPADKRDALVTFAKGVTSLADIFAPFKDVLVSANGVRVGNKNSPLPSKVVPFNGLSNALLSAHAESAAVDAIIDKVIDNYAVLDRVAALVEEKHLRLDNRNAIIEVILREAEARHGPSGRWGADGDRRNLLIKALADYDGDGINVNAESAIVMSGPSAVRDGLVEYAEARLIASASRMFSDRVELFDGFNLATEEETHHSWKDAAKTDVAWFALEKQRISDKFYTNHYRGNVSELLDRRALTFKQGWPIVEGRVVLSTSILQQLLDQLGEQFIRAMNDRLSGEIMFNRRVFLSLEQRQQIAAQEIADVPRSIGAQALTNLNEALTLIGADRLSVDQLSPLHRVVLGDLFGALTLDDNGFTEAWNAAGKFARENQGCGVSGRFERLVQRLRDNQSEAFAHGVKTVSTEPALLQRSIGLKAQALAHPLSTRQLGEHVARIEATIRDEYRASILQRGADVRQKMLEANAVSARMLPQDLLVLGTGDPGRRCYPLALLAAAALVRGDEAERALIGRIANASLAPKDAESRGMFAALDDLAGVATTEFGHVQGALGLDAVVQRLEATVGSAVYLLDTGNHSLLAAKVLIDDHSVYRFFDPNFGIFGFTAADELQRGMSTLLVANGEMATLYGLDGSADPQFTVVELDAEAIANKVLPSKLSVKDLLNGARISAGQNVSVWDAHASALMRSLSGNIRMGESLAQFDARYHADQFEDATRRLRDDNKLGDQYLPILESVQETSQKHYKLTMVDGCNPQVSIEVRTVDSRFMKIARHINRLAQRGGGPAGASAESDGGSRLSFAFAIQAIINEIRSREYQQQGGKIPALSIALQVQVYVGHAQLGFGVAIDTLQMVNLVRQVAASEKTLAASHASLSGQLLGRAASTVGLGFSAVNVGFDIHGLATATNQEQHARHATQLAFNIASFALHGVALAIGGTAGTVASVLAVPLLGIGIGAAAIASNLGQIRDKAQGVGRHLFMINEAYTEAGHKINDGVLTFSPEAVITDLDLRRDRVTFGSQKFFPTIFETVGLPSFETREPHRAINIREALHLPSSLTIDKQKRVDAVVLPCTPDCYYGYEYQLGWSDFSPDVDLRERLLAYQREWDQGDTSLQDLYDFVRDPVGALVGGDEFSTSFPNILDHWKTRLEFDKHGNRRFQFFSTAPFPHVLYKLHPSHKPTVISVILDQTCRQLVVPQLPVAWENLLSYEITAHSGQVRLTLTPGIISVVLKRPPLVDGPSVEAFAPPAEADWVIAAPWASEERVVFEGSSMIIDGIRIEGFEGFLQLQDSELFQVDRSRNNTLLLVRIDLQVPSGSVGDSPGQRDGKGTTTSGVQSRTLLARLRHLRKSNRLASPRIPVSGFQVPLTPSDKTVLTQGYYDAALDRMLYPRNLPEAVNKGVVLGGVTAEHAWFFHPDHSTIWRVDALCGTVRHRYRLMNPAQGSSRITGFRAAVGGGLRITQQVTGFDENSYSLEYVIHAQELTFISFTVSSASEELFQRTLAYWKRPLHRLMQPKPYIDQPADTSLSLSTWKAAPFIGLYSFDNGEFAYSGWLRLHDSQYIFNRFEVTQRTMLMWGQTDNQLAIIHDKESRTLIRVPLSRIEDWDKVDDIIETNVVEMNATAGHYVATLDDGRLFEVDMDGALRFVGVGKRWLELHPDWLDALPRLAREYQAAPFAVIGLAQTSRPAFMAAWCIAGQMLLCGAGDGEQLTLLRTTPDAKAAWVFDSEAGRIYRQTLVDFDTLRGDVAERSRLLNPEHLPKAEPVWTQWRFSEVEARGEHLLAQTREGVNLTLFDGQPARVIGVHRRWADVEQPTGAKLRGRLKTLVSAHPHVTFLPVGEEDGRFRYYIPESDELFEVLGPLDGQWPTLLGIRNGSVPLMYETVRRCVYSSSVDPDSISYWMEDCQVQRKHEVMSIASRDYFLDMLAVLPQGVEKVLMTFGLPQQMFHVTDEHWQRLSCIVLQCRPSPEYQPSEPSTLFLDMSASEHLVLSAKDGDLVFTDPDNAHSLIVRNEHAEEGELVTQMEIHVSVGAGEHCFGLDHLLDKVKVEQAGRGYVEMKVLIAATDSAMR